MLSAHWTPGVVLLVKVFTLGFGAGTAGVGWWAAHLWLEASRVEIEDTTPRTMVSYDDNPALGILGVEVAGYAIQKAYRESAALNARAAVWTAWAAILAGAATVLGAL